MKNLLAALTLTLSLTVTAQSNIEMDPLNPYKVFTVIYDGAQCGCDGCSFFFRNAATGKDIDLSWNSQWDGLNDFTYPDIDNESATILSHFENCAIYGTECLKVINKKFTVTVVRKRREVWRWSPEGWEETGKMETYFEITKIRYK